jgi:hypothetical protein
MTMLGYGHQSFVMPFLHHVGGRMATTEEILANRTLPMVLAGPKSMVPMHANKYGLDWYYIDTGYIGNGITKTWFRVTKNCHQNTGPIIDRRDDRIRSYQLDTTRYARGRRIMIVPPDDKVCTQFGLTSCQTWLDDIVPKIQSLTDREIVIRSRPASRYVRQTSNRFVDALQDDINAVVVFNSNCAVESVMHGIPVICLGESAAAPMSGNLQQIDALADLDTNEIHRWLRHLSYCQFTKREMQFGLCWRMLNER